MAVKVDVKRKRAQLPVRPPRGLNPLIEEKWEDKNSPVNVADRSDPIDKEISAAIRLGRPVNISAAFPDKEVLRSPKVSKLMARKEELEERSEEYFDKVIDEDGEEPVPELPEGEESHVERLAQIEKYSPHYKQEYRLRLLNRLVLRGVTMDEAAGIMGCSIRTITRDRAVLRKRLRDEASRFDTNLFLGRNFALYAEITEMAMHMANTAPSGQERRDAMRVAMQSSMDANRMAALWRIPEVKPYEGSQNEGGVEGGTGNDLINMVRAVMSGSKTVDEFMIKKQNSGADKNEEDDILL